MAKPLHLIPDAPITGPGFDRLDRMAFVRSFSEAIRAAKGTDSVVLALAGPWGSGKSSLLNLITGELNERAGDKKPLVVKFNPWWFTGTNQLVAAFLQQVGAALSRPEVKDLLGEATDALDDLADAIAAPGIKHHEKSLAERDIQMIRDRVVSIFMKSDRRILIFMDDIDRLSPEEMAQLLLIVRAIADFPNTTYVLSFDYEVVVEAMANKLGVDGRTYLEKVVQLQIDVPLPRRMTLERMVVGQLTSIDPAAHSLDDDAKMHFRILFEGGVKHFLATPRACTRLLNVLRFTYPTLKGQVYFPDMLGLATLMAFSSQAVQAIRSFSDAFVGHCDEKGRGWIGLKQFHQSWLEKLSDKDRSAVESLVRTMFPKVSWALDGPMKGEEYAEAWAEQQRICSPKHFDAYFRLGLSAGEAAEYQWQNMVELLDDATSFAHALQQFGPVGEEEAVSWVGELLQQASDFVNERASSDQARNLFLAIMSRGDQIASVRDSQNERLLIEPIHWVVSLLLDCLKKIERPDERMAVLRQAVSEKAGLLTAGELLELLEHRVDIFADKSSTQSIKGKTQQLIEVLKILDQRIQQASENGELAIHPQYLKIAQKWHKFGRKSKSKKWVREVCESDRAFVRALQQVVHGLDAESENENASDSAIPVTILELFFKRVELLERTKSILFSMPTWLSPEGEYVLEAVTRFFQPGFKRRAKGRKKKAQT